MKLLKFEIILLYYKRPEIVKNSLDSIKKSSYNNWHLTFIDDSGDNSFEKNLDEFGFDKSKITYVPIMMSDDEKIKLQGSLNGKYMNDAIYLTDADIIIPICDDDALVSDYMEKLNEYYNKNDSVVWSYCYLNFYDPYRESYLESKSESENPALNYPYLNDHKSPLNPYMCKDFSQVTFRKNALVEKEIKYLYPKNHDLDAAIFNDFFEVWGPCHFNGLRGQHKGWHEEQLGVRIRTGRGHFFSPQKYL
jgi:hypothetical protein